MEMMADGVNTEILNTVASFLEDFYYNYTVLQWADRVYCVHPGLMANGEAV